MNKEGKSTERIEKFVAGELRRRGVMRLLIGVSGGADSSALLLASVASGVEVTAVHCNYHLRGEESNRDAAAVAGLCEKLGVPLIDIEFNVAEYRDSNPGISVEMACRDLRYAEFRRLMDEIGADRIAVAHNSDDNIETMLLNLFRGSGVTGLRGMLPDTGEIIRPLLSISRKEIEEYLLEKGYSFVTDSTNSETDYRRNYIRNILLPAVENRWPGARKAITTTIANLRSEENVLKEAERRFLPQSDLLPMKAIAEAPDRFWIIRSFSKRYGATRDIALEILDVYEKRSGTQHIIGKKWKAGRGMLRFSKKGLEYFC